MSTDNSDSVKSMGDHNSVEDNITCQHAVSANGFGGTQSLDAQDGSSQLTTKSCCIEGPDWQSMTEFWEVEQGKVA